jgi:hypothetical protein
MRSLQLVARLDPSQASAADRWLTFPNVVENDEKSGLEGVVPDRFAVNQGSTTFSCRSHRRLSIVVVVGMYSRET